MISNGITTGTPSQIPFGAGVYFAGVTFNPLVAPTEADVRAHLIGATQEGGSISITPEFFHPTLDGAHVPLKELDLKVGETARMEVSFAELKSDTLAKNLVGTAGKTTDGLFDVVTSAPTLGAGHLYEGFGYWGQFLDGRPLIVIFKQALCTSGFTTEAKDKTNSLFKGVFECRSDLNHGADTLPWAIFIRSADGWTTVEQ